MYSKMITTIGMLYGTQIVLDTLWLGFIAKNFYSTQFKMVTGGIPPLFNIPMAFFVWFIMVVGHYMFVKQAKPHGLATTLLYGMTYGFIVFAVYDFTNKATLPVWPWTLLIVDVAWGVFANACLSIIVFLRK